MEKDAIMYPMRRRKGLSGHQVASHVLFKRRGASYMLMHGKHSLVALLNKNLIFQERKTKLPFMYL
jgi:hypothetical protein